VHRKGNPAVIQLRQIEKSFGDNRVLDGVNLSITKGEIVALIGPSGTGKTTLLRCINFLELADAGTVSVEDITIDCQHASRKSILAARRKTAMVFQSYNLFRNKTVLQNVTEGLIIVKRISSSEANRRAMEELDRVGMADKASSYPSQISGGQQQRVAIARAMALDPSIILFDEPTSALDPQLSSEVLDTIKQVATTGVTMLIVTHEISFARDISHRIVFMEGGNIVEEGTPHELFSNPQHERTKAFIGVVAPPDFQI
jgi:L-cystine transport system ATP-binding protein